MPAIPTHSHSKLQPWVNAFDAAQMPKSGHPVAARDAADLNKGIVGISDAAFQVGT